MFSHFTSHSPTVTHKGYKVLMENRPELPDGTANPPVASVGIAGLSTGQAFKAEHGLAQIQMYQTEM